MVGFLKNLWWVFLLILAGGFIFFLSFYANKPQADQGVVLNDIFHQQINKNDPVKVPTVLPKKIEPVVPPMAIVTTAAAGQGQGVTIQVYSFQDKKRALSALQTLKTSGYQAFLIVSDLGEKGLWYRVRVGGVMDEVAAHKMLEEIRQNYNSGFILNPQK